MAIFAIDNLKTKNYTVRGLLYDNVSELSGKVLVTANEGTVKCDVGSVAMKAGFKDIKQLDSSGTWQDA
jgi:hypothetical protein